MWGYTRLIGIASVLLWIGCTSESDQLLQADPPAPGNAGETSGAGGGTDEPAGSGGQGGERAGSVAEGGDAGAQGGSTVELTLDVIEHGDVIPTPGAGVSVRIDGKGASVETRTNERGHAAATLDAATGPWEVTVARADFHAVSIIDVTGPIRQPLHLYPQTWALPSTDEISVSMSGAIRGRTDSSTQVHLEAPAVGTVALWETKYSATVSAAPDTEQLRILVTERDASVDPNVGGPILNALWLNIPWTGADLIADIDFPAPPRHSSPMTMVIEAPTTGAVIAAGFTATADRARRVESNFAFNVGGTEIIPDPNVEGRFMWTIDALAGDMAPTVVATSLHDDSGERLVYVRAVPDEGAVIDVPPAKQLDAVGAEIDSLSLSWEASAYSRVGASVRNTDGRGGAWFVYSSGNRKLIAHAWPRLPSDVSLADVGLAEGELQLNVFALSIAGDVEPWNSNGEDEHAVMRTYRLDSK